MSDTAIRVNNLSKQYRIGQRKPYKTVRETIQSLFRTSTTDRAAGSSPKSFWALKDINFEVKQGEVIGIIGRNGAGKSTLLKVLSRITEPTTGEIETIGRVGSLLEVGTGFHPELTGRENVFLNGAILGMRKAEVAAKFDEIVNFAGVEKFLDTAVKHYSSGMYMRLAFAVAAHLEPEILVIDEVLAVGDAEFQAKCLGKMGDVARQGRTILFVSHQLNAIQALCSRAIRLDGGKIIDTGEAREVIGRYLAVEHAKFEWKLEPGDSAGSLANPYFSPTRFAVVDASNKKLEFPLTGKSEVRVLIEGDVEDEHSSLTLGFAIVAASGELLFWSLATDGPKENWPKIKKGRNTLVGTIPPHLLNEGEYRLHLILSLHCLKWLSEPGVNAPSVALTIKGGLSDSPFWMEARPGLTAPILRFELQS